MSELPNGWAAIALEELGSWGSGGTPKRTDSRFYSNGTIPWLVIGDLNNGVVTKAQTYITEEGLLNSSAKLLPPNTLLIAMYGSIGKLGITGIECATNQAIAFCIPDQEIIALRYLFHALKHSRDKLTAQGQGVAQKNISQTILKVHQIPVAPRREQSLIADKLDSLLTRVDTCRDRLDRASRIIKRFRQAIFKAATSGQLTEEWRIEHQALDSDDGIEEELTEFDFKDAACFDDFSFPTSWHISRLGKIAEIVGGITKDSKKQVPTDEELPYLRVANVQRGFLDLSEIKTIRVPQHRVEDLLLKPGDILFNEGGDIDKLGRGWMWSGEIERCTFQNHVFRVRLHNNLFEPKFFSWYGNSRGAAYFLAFGKQTTNLASINKSRLSALPIVIPQIEEQREIVRRVELLLAYADRLEGRYQNALRRVEQVTSTLLSTAFRGELVPQDPNDEPAAILLERIRAEQFTKPKRVVVNRKPKMPKMTEESVKEVIRQLPSETFSFDELREKISGDYDSFKDILFILLSEAEPSLVQVFDQEAKAMRFIRGNQ